MEKDLIKKILPAKKTGSSNVRNLMIAVSFMAGVAWVIYRDLKDRNKENIEVLKDRIIYLQERVVKADKKIDSQDSIIYIQGNEQKETIEKLNYLTETQNDQIKLLTKKK